MPGPSVTAAHHSVFTHWKLFSGRLTRSLRVFKVEKGQGPEGGPQRRPLTLTEPPMICAGMSEGPQVCCPHPCHVANVGGRRQSASVKAA